jgi:hypothetical protein
VEIESQWTGRRREQVGVFPNVRMRSAEETPAQASLDGAPSKVNELDSLGHPAFTDPWKPSAAADGRTDCCPAYRGARRTAEDPRHQSPTSHFKASLRVLKVGNSRREKAFRSFSNACGRLLLLPGSRSRKLYGRASKRKNRPRRDSLQPPIGCGQV